MHESEETKCWKVGQIRAYRSYSILWVVVA